MKDAGKPTGFSARGGRWVLTQGVLLLLFALAPHVGLAWPEAAAFRTVGVIGTLAGVGVLAWSAVGLGRSLTPFPRPLPSAQLVTHGAYRFVRHPIYFGVLLAALGLSLWTLSPLRLLLTAILTMFFDRKADREEQWLLERYPQYRLYRASVKKLVPWIY